MDKLSIKELVELGIIRLKKLGNANIHSGRPAECRNRINSVDDVLDEIKIRVNFKEEE